jgi:hypothetical protein
VEGHPMLQAMADASEQRVLLITTSGKNYIYEDETERPTRIIVLDIDARHYQCAVNEAPWSYKGAEASHINEILREEKANEFRKVVSSAHRQKKGRRRKWKKSRKKSILIIFIFIFLFVVGKNGGKFYFRKIRLISEIARYKALSPNPYKYLSLGRYIYINFIFIYIGLLTTATRNFCGRFEVLDGK